MTFLPILLALAICFVFGAAICMVDHIHESNDAKGRLDIEQEDRMAKQQQRLQVAKAYASYLMKR